MGNSPGRFPEALGYHPPFRFENPICTGGSEEGHFLQTILPCVALWE
jgi:hypothetical protein